MANTFQPKSVDTDFGNLVRQPSSDLRAAVIEVAGGAPTAAATTTVIGGVKKTAAITAIPTPASATATEIATKVNELLTALKAAGAVS